jgi:hypothetical protein
MRALKNPFEIMSEAAKPITAKLNLSSRSTPVCSRCRSDDVVCHVTAQWSNEAQEWQLAGTFGQPAHCNTCSAESGLDWHLLN